MGQRALVRGILLRRKGESLLTAIYVDADACPVKDEVQRVAARHGLKTWLVSNGGIRPSRDPLVEVVVVGHGADVADDWIAERAGRGDVVVTNDIPLAARVIPNGAVVLKPNGDALTEESIGMAHAVRNLMTDLRDSGEITGGPRAFSKADRSAFLNKLETVVRQAKAASGGG